MLTMVYVLLCDLLEERQKRQVDNVCEMRFTDTFRDKPCFYQLLLLEAQVHIT